MIKVNHLFLIFLFFIFCQGCSTKSTNNEAAKEAAKNDLIKTDDGKKYVLTIYQDKLNSAGNKSEPSNRIDTLTAVNDTVAYLSALKSFYNQKVVERKHFNYGQPKSFIIVDANGIDLKVNLSDKIVTGLKDQIENTPDVKKMLNEYQKDSL
jgi:hypothetical protein